MSELPFAASVSGGGLYSIEEQEQFHAHLIDHANDNKVTAITNMIDQAANDISMGLDYLTHTNGLDQRIIATSFLDDGLRAL